MKPTPSGASAGTPRTHRYRLQRSDFGLFLGITAEATRLTHAPTGGVPVSDRVWLDVSDVGDAFRGNRLALTDHEVAHLRLGLGTVSGGIERIEASPHVVISIRALEIVDADYAEEALAPAIAGWAEKEFALSPRIFDVSRDGATGRLTFTWDE